MNPDILKTLEGVGLSKNETKVYVTLLKLGLGTATEIAQESKLHRPNVYDSLHSLIEKGIASFIIHEKTKKFKAVDPNNLVLLMKQKEVDLLKVIPALQLESKLAREHDSFAEVHYGKKAFSLIVMNMLEYGKPFISYGIPKIVPQVIAGFVENFHKERIRRKIPFLHIYNEDAKDRIKYLNSLDFTTAVYLPEQFNSPVSTTVCGPEVLITRWDPMMSIRIVDKNLADTYFNYGTQLGKMAKKYT